MLHLAFGSVLCIVLLYERACVLCRHLAIWQLRASGAVHWSVESTRRSVSDIIVCTAPMYNYTSTFLDHLSLAITLVPSSPRLGFVAKRGNDRDSLPTSDYDFLTTPHSTWKLDFSTSALLAASGWQVVASCQMPRIDVLATWCVQVGQLR